MDSKSMKEDEWQESAARIDAAFVAWLEKEGVEHSALEWPCMSRCGVRTARTKSAMKASTPYMSVPESLMLTPSKAMTDELIGPVARKVRLRGDALLAVFVLSEARKGVQSKWYPYLRSLPLVRPSESNQSLDEWDKEIQDLLADDHLISKARQRRRWVEEVYDRVIRCGICIHNSVDFPLDWYTLERFETCWQLVQSRAFGRRLKESALVPLADALNHGDLETEYALINGQFRLWPLNELSAGAEALNAYGSQTTNAKLLLDYGFSLPQNRFDSLAIATSLSEDDPLIDRKRRLVRTAGLGIFGIFTLTTQHNPAHPSPQLDVLRIAVATAEDIDLMETALDQDDASHRTVLSTGSAKLCCQELNVPTLFSVARAAALRRLLSRLNDILSDDQNKYDADIKHMLSCETELAASAQPRRDLASWFWQGTQDPLGPPHNIQYIPSKADVLRTATERKLFALRYRTTRASIAIAARTHILDALRELDGEKNHS